MSYTTFFKQDASWFYLSVYFTNVKTMENSYYVTSHFFHFFSKSTDIALNVLLLHLGSVLKHVEAGVADKGEPPRVCSQAAGEGKVRADTQWAVTEWRGGLPQTKTLIHKNAWREAKIWRLGGGVGGEKGELSEARGHHREGIPELGLKGYVVFWSLQGKESNMTQNWTTRPLSCREKNISLFSCQQ